jgi:hypothetical protein
MNDLQRAFDLLRLKPDATSAEVKRAFRDQVSEWHPDRFAADPAMQRRAEQRLRLVIEAHRSIVAHRASQASEGDSAGCFVAGDERPGSPVPAGTFFRSGPNMVFSSMVLGTALLALIRHGMTIHALAYGLEIALIPALFSLGHNLTARNSTAVRNLYVACSLCALAFVVAAGLMTGSERSVPTAERERAFQDGYDDGTVVGGRSLSRENDWAPAGGLPPAAHEPRAAGAPALPLAPVAPAAPRAPAAPVAPLAR